MLTPNENINFKTNTRQVFGICPISNHSEPNNCTPEHTNTPPSLNIMQQKLGNCSTAAKAANWYIQKMARPTAKIRIKPKSKTNESHGTHELAFIRLYIQLQKSITRPTNENQRGPTGDVQNNAKYVPHCLRATTIMFKSLIRQTNAILFDLV